MICAWIDTSSAETGSSATMKLGLERERARDADALALAAGELMRVARAALARQADLIAAGRHARRAARAALADAVHDAAARR